jgi:hypothetical protein
MRDQCILKVSPNFHGCVIKLSETWKNCTFIRRRRVMTIRSHRSRHRCCMEQLCVKDTPSVSDQNIRDKTSPQLRPRSHHSLFHAHVCPPSCDTTRTTRESADLSSCVSNRPTRTTLPIILRFFGATFPEGAPYEFVFQSIGATVSTKPALIVSREKLL